MDSTRDHRSPSLSLSAQADVEKRRTSLTNSSQHARNTISPERTDRRKPSSIASPFLYASNRKVSTNTSPRGEPVETAAIKLRGASTDVMPTFRMEPHPDRRFRPSIVKKIMDDAFEASLDPLDSYDPVKCRNLTTQMCEDIKQKVKWLNFERFKLICVVHIGSVNGQGLRVASQCLWDHKCDNFASTSYQKGDIFAVALLFGVYKE